MRTVPQRRRGNESLPSVSVDVIEMIAGEVGCAPDALDRLIQFDTAEIEFSFDGFDILIRGSKNITISATEPDLL